MTELAQRYLHLCAQRSKPKLIIDTDPGIDDAAAILLALGLEKMGLVDVLGLTCVAGNVSVYEASKNACVIADWAMRRHLPVHSGADKPLLKPLVTAEHIHGLQGLGNIQRHKPQTPLQAASAVSYLIDTLAQAEPYSITLCAIGPLTNIAQLLSLSPLSARGIKEIVIMGGAYFNVGNVTPVAEFNFFVDPHAAQMVLQAGIPLYITPLDVTHKVRLHPARIQALRALGNDNGLRLADMFDNYQRHQNHNGNVQAAPLHDPCAIACAVWPELFEYKRVHVQVETQGQLTMGACVVDFAQKHAGKPNAHWVTDIDDEAFFDLFTQAIGQLI